jgi:predicted porin
MNREGLKTSDSTAAANDEKTRGQTLGVRYSFDALTVGVNQMKEKIGTASGTIPTETKQMEYGLGYAVSKDLSIGLTHTVAKRENITTDATNGDKETTTSIALGYSLGPVALSAQYGEVKDMGGVKASDAKVMFIALTTAF